MKQRHTINGHEVAGEEAWTTHTDDGLNGLRGAIGAGFAAQEQTFPATEAERVAMHTLDDVDAAIAAGRKNYRKAGITFGQACDLEDEVEGDVEIVALADASADTGDLVAAGIFAGTMSDEALAAVMNAEIGSVGSDIAAREYSLRNARKTLTNAIALLAEDVAKGDLYSAAWASARIGDLLEDPETLAAYGKRIVRDGFKRRLVDVDELDVWASDPS